MGRFTWDRETLRYARNRAKFWGLRIVQARGLPWQEAEDIESDIMLDVLCRMEKYDETRAGAHTFIARIVYHRAMDILNSWKDGKLSFRRLEDSIDQLVPFREDPRTTLDDPPQEEETVTSGLRTRWGSLEDLDRRIDLDRQISRLSDHLQGLCERLKFELPAEVARSRGVHPEILYEEIREIRRVFRERR